jgi:hypothetical protein
MPLYMGSMGKGGYKLETSYGAGGTPVTTFLPIIGEDMRANPEKIASPAMFGSRNVRTYYVGRQDPKGSVTFMIDPDNIPALIFAALGVEGNATQVLVTQAEITEITCAADVGGSLSGKYWTLNSPTTEYYVWYDVTGLGSADPAIAGKTGIPVGIAVDATASAVATATKDAIDAKADFGATVATAKVTVTNAADGAVADAADGDTGFTPFTVTQQGSGGAAYDHVFTPADNTVELKSFALEIDREGTCCIYSGCMVNEFGLEFSLGNPVQVTLGLLAQKETDDQTATELIPSTKLPYIFHHATVKINDVQVFYVRSGSLTYSNQIPDESGFTANGTAYRHHCYKTGGLLTGSFDCEWTSASDALRDYHLDNTDTKIEIFFTSTEVIEAGYYYTLTIEIPIAKIMGDPPVLSDRGATPFTVNWEAMYDATNYWKVTHRDARTTKWSA